MKKIAVITMGVRLEGEPGYTRFRYLSEFLVQAGYEVDLITTTFQHWQKEQRDIEKIDKSIYTFGLKFIYEPGYKKNVDFKRVKSHKIAAGNLIKLLDNEGNYDLIYAEIPPNDVALAAAEYAHSRGIPFVVDVNDLWPEAMKVVLDIPIFSNLLFHAFQRDAEKVYQLASGVIGTSDEYRDRPFKNCKRDIPKATVYVGNEIQKFDISVEQMWEKVEKPKSEFWVSYAGTIGTSYDIKTIVLAGEELKKRGKNHIKIKILGEGPTRQALERLVKDKQITNVEFLGYVQYDVMAVYLKKSDILVNSFVKKAAQSIVTKIGDYLAAGQAMINTCSSSEFKRKVEKDGFGVNIEAENVNILADAIEDLEYREAERIEMGRRARHIAETQFDRPETYQKIEALIRQLL